MLPKESGGSFTHRRRPVGQVPDLAAFLQRGGSNSAVQASAVLTRRLGLLPTWTERGLTCHVSSLHLAGACTASLGGAPDAMRLCMSACCRPSAHASPLTHQALQESRV